MTSKKMAALRDARLRTDDTCHICGHPGADVLDHLTPRARGGTDHPSNLAPAHHDPCPDCGKQCNRLKGDRMFAPIIRRSGTLKR